MQNRNPIIVTEFVLHFDIATRYRIFSLHARAHKIYTLHCTAYYVVMMAERSKALDSRDRRIREGVGSNPTYDFFYFGFYFFAAI